MPSLVVGDLNDVGWSYTSQLFQKYSELLDPRIGRGLYNTYNVNIPLFRYPLDHFFYSSHFGFIGMKRLNAIGSDHYPMVLEVALNKAEEDKNNLPKADQDDKEEVKEIIEKGK
jgi:endonuclease/exonuclease/phosphatase (EEP) superfamily protein YafD